MPIKKRIYLVGVASGSYRSRALLGYLMASPNYGYFHHDVEFLTPKNDYIFFRALFKGLRIVDRFLTIPCLVLSDIVYILPMANLNFIERLLIKFFKKKVVGEFYISTYDTFVNDRKTVNKDSFRAKYLLKSDRDFNDICDQIIFLNASEREYYLKLINRESVVTKTTLIPLATNCKEKAQLPFVNSKSTTLTLCWWGTFIPLHGLEKIVESAKYLKAYGLDFKLYLFGTSEEKSVPYRRQISDLELEDCVFIENSKNFADKSLDIFLIEHCDIAFGNFGDSEKAKTVMVNKVVESASMGLPVVSQKTLALGEYFENGVSISFCEADSKKIAENIIELYKDKVKLKNIAESGYKLYISRFSKEAYLKDIMQVLDKVQ
jgi:glycosyltransferase involved in cell wall biosynthesis